MTRMLLSIFAFAMVLALGGCGWFSTTAKNDKQQGYPGLPNLEPENIMVREWSSLEVACLDFDKIESSKYFNSYETLDDDYQVDIDTADNWNKTNLRGAIVDPLVTIKDAVLAPLKYSRDLYLEHQSKNDTDCLPCRGEVKQ